MKAIESDDPFELVGTGYPVEDQESADRITTRCLVEEYALAGFSASEIRRLFASPLYAHSYAIFSRRGADFLEALIGDVFGGSR